MNTYYGEVNGQKFKYEDDTLYRLKDTCRYGDLKNPYWRATKGSLQKTKKTRAGETGYYTISCKNKNYYVHRVTFQLVNEDWDITDNSKSNQVDHKDGNKANNKIENLRILTASENQHNNYHYAKGYYWNRARGRYIAQIRCGQTNHYLGTFLTADKAREAYLIAKIKYHPEPT